MICLHTFGRVKGARLAIAAYCVFSFSAIGFDELASLWMATKPYRGYRISAWRVAQHCLLPRRTWFR